jgi:DNA-binding MarR family transcriptional regulator
MRKLQVLKYIAYTGEVTSDDLADTLDLEIHHARMTLLRYHRQGLLGRRHEEGSRRKIYRITDKGLSRIEYLENT